MRNCLLVGNGLNQCLPDGISWGNLLAEIATKYNTNYDSSISMPLEFERIVNEYLQRQVEVSGDIFSEIKEMIINKIKESALPKNAVHHRIKEFQLDAIITTNYDSLLEQVYDPSIPDKVKSSTKKYLESQTSLINGVRFYHAHGFYPYKQSICLGYEHYAGILQHLRGEYNTVPKGDKKKRICQILEQTIDETEKWGELFYTSNIAIIGFGLWESEIDFWWLITHRAYLYYTNYQNIRQHMKNRIIYYDIIDDVPRENKKEEAQRVAKSEQQRSKHQLLKDSHIEVKLFSLSQCGNYEQAYHRMFDDFAENGFERIEEELAYV